MIRARFPPLLPLFWEGGGIESVFPHTFTSQNTKSYAHVVFPSFLSWEIERKKREKIFSPPLFFCAKQYFWGRKKKKNRCSFHASLRHIFCQIKKVFAGNFSTCTFEVQDHHRNQGDDFLQGSISAVSDLLMVLGKGEWLISSYFSVARLTYVMVSLSSLLLLSGRKRGMGFGGHSILRRMWDFWCSLGILFLKILDNGIAWHLRFCTFRRWVLFCFLFDTLSLNTAAMEATHSSRKAYPIRPIVNRAVNGHFHTYIVSENANPPKIGSRLYHFLLMWE